MTDTLFESAPVSLWLEDFSAVRTLFAEWRAEGIDDIDAFFATHPEQVEACAAGIRVVNVNRRTLELFSARDFDHLVANLGQVFRGDMHKQHAHDMAALWRGEAGFSSQSVNYAIDGRRIDVLLNAHVLPGHENDLARVLISLEDITARVQAERRLASSELYARGLFEHSPVSLWVEDFSGVKRLIDDVRAAGIVDFRTFLHVHPEFVTRCMQQIEVIDINQQTLKLLHASSRTELLENIDRVLRDEMQHHFAEQLIDLWNGQLFMQREVVNYALTGQPIDVHMQFSVLPGHEMNWDLVQVALTDITARKRAEAYLEYLGSHDALTKLNNRASFDQETARLARKGVAPISVIVADLNGLKTANDTLGHSSGDDLLRRAGEALRKAAGDGVFAARIGGDEFAILLPVCDASGANQVVERIGHVVEMNNQFYAGPRLNFSLGTATAMMPADLDDTIKRADESMYAAKRLHYSQRERELPMT